MQRASLSVPSDRAMEIARNEGLRRLLMAATRSINAQIMTELAKSGFENTRPGHTLLLANLDLDGNSVIEVAERANISKQSMARLAIELEEMKLITRRPSDADRRTLVLRFTARGRALIRTTIAVLDRLERELSREIGPGDLATLKRGLRIIAERHRVNDTYGDE